MKDVIVRNVFSNWAGLFVNLVITFFLSPFLVHSLGDTMYGLWVLILSVTGYMGLLDAGLRVSIVRFVSRSHAIRDFEELNKAIITSLIMYGVLAVLVFLGGLGIALNFGQMFTVPSDALPVAQIVLILAGANLALTFPLSVFSGFLAGLQRYDIINKIGIVIVLGRSLAIIIFVSQGFGIITLALIHLGCQIFSGVFLFFASRKQSTPLRLHMRAASFASLKMLYNYSAFILLNNLAMLLLFRSGAVIVGAFIGAAAVTYYSIADSLTHYLGTIIGTMTQVLHPNASAQEAKGETEKIKASVVFGTKICMLIALPFSTIFVILGDQFISGWMGESYAVVAAPLLAVLTFARLSWLSQSATGNILLGIGKHKIVTSINMATGVACLIGAVAGIQQGGLYGMVVGSSLPLVISHGVVLPLYTCHALSIQLSTYLLEAFVRPIIATVPFGCLLFMLNETPLSGGLLGFFLIVLVSAPVYLLLAYFGGFSRSERRSYLSAFKSLWSPASKEAL